MTDILFDDAEGLTCMGRNGVGTCIGVSVADIPPDWLRLQAINSRRKTAAMSICLPWDRAFLLRVGDVFATIADGGASERELACPPGSEAYYTGKNGVGNLGGVLIVATGERVRLSAVAERTRNTAPCHIELAWREDVLREFAALVGTGGRVR